MSKIERESIEGSEGTEKESIPAAGTILITKKDDSQGIKMDAVKLIIS